MKKVFKSFIVMAGVLSAIVSCNKEVSSKVDEIGDRLVEVTLIASNPTPETATKTEIEGLQPYWSVGDEIGVSLGTSSNYKFTSDITSRSVSASFTGTTSVSSDLYAYYPYSTINNPVSAEGVKVDIPAVQHPTATSFDGKADLMVAKKFTVDPAGTTVTNLQFKRLGAVVKVVLKDKDKVLTAQHPTNVSLTAGSDLVGRLRIDMVNQTLGDFYYGQSHTVTAEYTSSTTYEINGTNATYLIVYPQTISSGTTLTVAATTEGFAIEKEIQLNKDIVLEAGKITTLNISLESNHITPVSAGAQLPFEDDMSWANNGTSDATADISADISTESSGLYSSATKAYKGIGGIKLGTGSATGSITTKELNLSGAFYIAIEGENYGSDTGNLVVSVDDDEVINEAFDAVNYINIPAGTYTNKSKVTISASVKRCRIYSVTIKAGEYSAAPSIKVTSPNPMAVTKDNDLYAIEYTIKNPVANTSISAASNVTWIHDFDYNTDGEVAFEVDAQTVGAAARTGVITLSYNGAADVSVTVNQAASIAYQFETIAELNALVTTTSGEYFGYLTDAIVSFVPATNTAIVKDATGSVMFFKTSHGLKQGQTFTGEITVTACIYKTTSNNVDYPLYSEVTAWNATFSGTETNVDPESVALADLVGNYSDYQNAYVKVAGLTVSSVDGKNIHVTDGTNNYVVYDNTSSVSVSADEVITAIGTITKYQTTEEIKVWKAADVIVTASAPKAITFSQPAAGGSFTVKVDGNNITSGTTVAAGKTVTLTATAATDYTFNGWTVSGATVADASAATTTFVMGSSAVTVSASFKSDNVASYVDVLTQSWSGISGTNYSAWSGKAGSASSAVYAGNSAGGNNAIQLRSNNSNSGVVSTTSGGKVKKIVVTWNSNTQSGRTLNVYGKNSAYSQATDLYDSSKQGTLLGTIVCGTSTQLTITGDYTYIGFRSASGAMYLDKVEITWEN